jgi:hypothetical protein
LSGLDCARRKFEMLPAGDPGWVSGRCTFTRTDCRSAVVECEVMNPGNQGCAKLEAQSDRRVPGPVTTLKTMPCTQKNGSLSPVMIGSLLVFNCQLDNSDAAGEYLSVMFFLITAHRSPRDVVIDHHCLSRPVACSASFRRIHDAALGLHCATAVGDKFGGEMFFRSRPTQKPTTGSLA